MKRRILGLILALTMVLGVLPSTAFAAEQNPAVDQVHVTVENTTYPVAEGAAWDGRVVDTWIDLNEGMTMMSAVYAALEESGIPSVGADGTYISEINGLGEFDGGEGSGWMATLNDWFVNTSLGIRL